jgi:hypothetical protein
MGCQSVAAVVPPPVPITLASGIVALTGPWKFRVGDDPRWAAPDFDDSSWESADLTPQPGAHDSDVGLMGYVPGWEARGHRGYSGYAWYRLRITVSAPPGELLALVGPTDVDSAYQIHVNGKLLGGIGNFSRSPPGAYGTNRPIILSLAPSFGPMVIAMRVWMGAWDVNGTDAGGIHVAPALGTRMGAEALYQHRWMEIIKGYFLDALLAVGFAVLAAMVCGVMALDGIRAGNLWLIAALLSVALMRANQAIFYWGRFETVQGFELITNVLLVPLMLGCWTIAWASWLELVSRRWLVATASVLTVLHIMLQCLSASWIDGAIGPAAHAAVDACVSLVRWLFVLLTLYVMGQIAMRSAPTRTLALLAITLISTGLFARELSLLGIPGIWFPFGTGVSRTQFAYAAFGLAFFALVMQRRMLCRTSVSDR